MAKKGKKGRKPNRWKNSIFLGSSGEAFFSKENAKAILDLMARQCKATRSAHQAIKLGKKGVDLTDKNAKAILDLMARQCKATRSAHQAIKLGKKGVDLTDALKSLGHDSLGVRYLTSAISLAEY